MCDLLTEGAVRGVFVDRIFVAWRARGLVVPRVRRARGKRDQAYALDFAGRLPDVYVALDDQRLNCQSHESEENHQNARARRLMGRVRRGCSFARGAPFCVAIVNH